MRLGDIDLSVELPVELPVPVDPSLYRPRVRFLTMILFPGFGGGSIS